MNIRHIIAILPRDYRRRCARMAAAVLLRVLLDFTGVAALLSVLLMLPGNAVWHNYTEWAALAGVIFLLAKNALVIRIEHAHSRDLLALYRHFSTRMLDACYHRGLLFVRATGAAKIAHQVNYVCYAFVLNVLAPLLRMTGEAMLLLLLMAALFIYAPQTAAWLSVCFLPMAALYMYGIRHRLTRYGEAENRAKSQQWQVVEELFRGYTEIETNQAYGRMSSRFNQGMDQISHNQLRLETCQRLPPAIVETGMAVALLVLTLTAGNDDMLVENLAVFGAAAFRILPGLRSLLGGWMQVRNNLYTVETLKEALGGTNDADEANDARQEKEEEELTFREEITVEHLCFAYPGTKEALIRNLSFSVKRGEIVGIRGISGAGKTTLFNLLLGLLRPTEGEIRLDGSLLERTKLKAWQHITGYVPQDVFIFDGSVTENIAPGLLPEEADTARIRQVLEQVRLTKWVDALPHGTATLLGENGSRISGGQRQRIGIARALYKGAKVLLFDEATSALDDRTEEELLEVIHSLTTQEGGITLLMIAHRQKVLSRCDRIIQIGNE